MGRNKKSNYQDDGVYYSNSTCDSSEKNYSLPDFDEQMKEVEEVPHQRTFKVEMHLALTPKGEKPVKIPVCVGEYASNRVLEVLLMSINARRVKQVIEAVLDNVPPEPQTFNKPVSESLKDIEDRKEQEKQPEAEKEKQVIFIMPKQEASADDELVKGQLTIGNDGAGHFADSESEDYIGGNDFIDGLVPENSEEKTKTLEDESLDVKPDDAKTDEIIDYSDIF